MELNREHARKSVSLDVGRDRLIQWEFAMPCEPAAEYVSDSGKLGICLSRVFVPIAIGLFIYLP
jgi:hypothetical protein